MERTLKIILYSIIGLIILLVAILFIEETTPETDEVVVENTEIIEPEIEQKEVRSPYDSDFHLLIDSLKEYDASRLLDSIYKLRDANFEPTMQSLFRLSNANVNFDFLKNIGFVKLNEDFQIIGFNHEIIKSLSINEISNLYKTFSFKSKTNHEIATKLAIIISVNKFPEQAKKAHFIKQNILQSTNASDQVLKLMSQYLHKNPNNTLVEDAFNQILQLSSVQHISSFLSQIHFRNKIDNELTINQKNIVHLPNKSLQGLIDVYEKSKTLTDEDEKVLRSIKAVLKAKTS